MTLLPNKTNYQFRGVELQQVLDKNSLPALLDFLNQSGGIDSVDEYQRTALMQCVFTRYGKAMDESRNSLGKELIAAGADINAEDKGGYTVLNFAIQEKNQEMTDFLLSQKQLNLTPEVSYLNTVLSSQPRNQALLIALIERGISPFEPEAYSVWQQLLEFQTGEVSLGGSPLDMTPVLEVVKQRYPEQTGPIPEYFLKDIVGDYQTDEIYPLLCGRSVKNVIEFLEHHGGIDGKNEYGRTLLSECIIRGNSPIKRMASMNKQMKKLSKVLLEMGADVSCKDYQGLTALDYAKRSQDDEMIRLIDEAGSRE